MLKSTRMWTESDGDGTSSELLCSSLVEHSNGQKKIFRFYYYPSATTTTKTTTTSTILVPLPPLLFSPRTLGLFNCGQIRVGFVVDKLARRQALQRVFRFFCQYHSTSVP